MGLEILVNNEDYVATYNHGLEFWQDYNEAKKLRGQGKSYDKIAKQLNRPISAVYGWIAKDKKPQCAKRLEQAQELGITPLNSNSEKTPALNKLISWVFWTGTLSTGYGISISEKPETLKELKKYFESTLELEGLCMKNENRNFLRFKKDSHIYGRVLACMGAPVSLKSKQENHIPQAIMKTPESYIDFLQVLFATRGRMHEYADNMTLHLMANKSEERAEEFGKEMVRFINKTLSEMNLTRQNLSIQQHDVQLRKKYTNYEPRIYLYKKQMTDLRENYPKLAKIITASANQTSL
jgi:hypothetical protein